MDSKIGVQEKKGVSFDVEFCASGMSGTANGKTLKENTFRRNGLSITSSAQGIVRTECVSKGEDPNRCS